MHQHGFPRAAACTTLRGLALRARILVVDDEPLVLRVIGRTLGLSHDVVTTSSPREALTLLGEQRFDVIVSDMIMPELWGGALYDEIALHHPDMCDRMVFLTGGSPHEEVARFLARVTSPRLDKPFGADGLEAIIQQVLARHAHAR